MKLHSDPSPTAGYIGGYGPGWFRIDQNRHEGAVLVRPGDGACAWTQADFEHLSPADFERVAALQPELVLFGSGARHRFVPPATARALIQAGIGVECMDSPAACRTFNILAAEGRNVVAALLPI